MKTTKYLLTVLSLPFWLFSSVQTAHAVSSFNGNVSITYTINSITNLNNPGSLEGLELNGQFELDDGQTFTENYGNAGSSIAHSEWFYGPIEDNVFSRTFSLSGYAGNGEAAASYLAMFGLEFVNNSSDAFDIDVEFAYSLSAEAAGDNAYTEIMMDYWDDLTGGGDFVELSAYATGNDQLFDSALFQFSLFANETQAILADVGVEGAVSAVPVPAAIWLFGSALFGMLGTVKFKSRQIEAC